MPPKQTRNQIVEKNAEEWASKLFLLDNYKFISAITTGRNGEEFGKTCLTPGMRITMQVMGWNYKPYFCLYYNGTEGSCKNKNCGFSHVFSPRWVKQKNKKNLKSCAQASEENVVPGNDKMPQTLISVTPISEFTDSQTSVVWPLVSPKVQKFSSDPEIKTWQLRLQEVTECLANLRSDQDYDDVSSSEGIQLCIKNIKTAEKKIADLKAKNSYTAAREAAKWADSDSETSDEEDKVKS